jgi:hypothetical protein
MTILNLAGRSKILTAFIFHALNMKSLPCIRLNLRYVEAGPIRASILKILVDPEAAG